jgi:IS4 transposase
MPTGKYVFSQIIEFVSRYEFEKCVARYDGNHRVRELNCWNQFLQLFFGQITSLNSLRDICLCLKVHKNKLYHLGIKQNVVHTTLSRANEHRDWRIFADFGEYLIGLVRPLYAEECIPDLNIDNDVFALDSTTISLSIKLFTWAHGKYSRGAVKVHTLLDLRGSIPNFILVTDGKYHDSNVLDEMAFSPEAIYLMDRAYVDFEALFRIRRHEAFFVTRAKQNIRFETVEQNFNIDSASGLRSDRTIRLTGTKSRRLYPEKLRLVELYDTDNDLTLTFLSNNFEVTAMEIADLYKNRWQIEVFFRWIKQNLTIKRLWGHSENAVKIHIWVAISTYLIVAYIKHELRSELSIYEIMQILGISSFDKTPIRELLTESISNQNVKEQLNLFNDNF